MVFVVQGPTRHMLRSLSRVVWTIAPLLALASPLCAQSASGPTDSPFAVAAPQVAPMGEEGAAADQSATPYTDLDPPPAAPARTRADDHMFGVLPNYSTVDPTVGSTPIGVRQKFAMASLNTFDPYVYPFVGFVAAFNHTYGAGMNGFLKQYPASLVDNAVGNFLTSAVVPSAIHQDPRYYQRGSGSFFGRVAYAASRSVITRSDAGHPQFNFSEIGGNALAAGMSNLYYPTADRTVTGTLSRWGMQVMWDTLSNEMKEFWPDVRRKLHGG